jgi:U3 small nucleolar RNA-associated protein 14
MARGGPSKLPRQESKDHNAKHALARRERKGGASAEGGPSSIHDVFEFVTNQEEAKKSGSSSRSAKREGRAIKRATQSDVGDQQAPKIKRRRNTGEEDDEDDEEEADQYGQTAPVWDADAGVRSEDDEEIDSDEAFGDSDEEKFEGWKFGSGKKEKSKGGVDETSEEDEEDEGEDEDDDEDLMDLSKLLDGEDSGEDDEESSISSADENEANGSDDERLEQRMQSLSGRTSTKRSAEDQDEGGKKGAKRRVLKERTEAVPESEWNAPSGRAGAPLLTIDDLMEPLKEQGGTAFTSLRDTAKILKPKRGDSTKAVAASKKGGGALQAPLPSIVQDRLDRSAAYDETKAEVQGWQPTIKRIREAEHLSFPLQPDPVIKPSTALMTSQFQPTNSFERDIASMLEREGMSDKRLAEAEELRMNERGMSAEEIKERRNELRKMRDLLFREEQKAKRVSKIKSKTYRKIARKQREREVAKAKEAGIAIGDEVDDDDEENEKAARLRAKERATLKHKNTGKWAQNIIGMHGVNHLSEARNAIEEQLRKGEQLRRRIQGQDSDEGEGEGEVDASEDEDGSQDEEDNVFDELRALEKRNETERASDEAELQGKKGVWGMQFMKNARDRKSKQTQDEVDNLQREMEELEKSDGQEESDDEDELDQRLMQAGANPGRRVFTSSAAATIDQRGTELDSVKISTAETGRNPTKSIVVQDTRVPSPPTHQEVDGEQNPWLAAKPTTKLSRKKNETTVSKDGTAQSKAANKIQKHIAKGDQERKEAMEDAQLDIDPEARLNLKKTEVRSGKAKKAKQARFEEADSEDSDEDGSLVDEPVIVQGRGPAAIQQRDLVAEAFAGDDVTTDFATEKDAIMQADAPQVIDTTLPGWGTWGGKGVRRPSKKKAEELKRKLTKVVPGLDPTKRKDANMVNVIINQRKDKKAEKYIGKDVPFPYTSRAQYELAMRNPLGPEWNTRTQHQKLTLPKVVTKPGKAIKPIERLF